MQNLPYVVSADVSRLVRRWCRQHRWQHPAPEFFAELSEQVQWLLRGVFSQVSYVSEAELETPVREWFSGKSVPVVSMDTVYAPPGALLLQMTRAVQVTESGFQNAGIISRTRYTVEQQAMAIKHKVGDQPIILFDDVVFEGNSLLYAASVLKKHGVAIREARVLISIGEGKTRFESRSGIPLISAHHYDAVIDEICERDFFPGVLQSGRTLVSDREIGVPYIYPFGDPCKWASFPQAQAQFLSREFIDITKALYQEVERINDVRIRLGDLPRQIYGAPHDQCMPLLQYLANANALAA